MKIAPFIHAIKKHNSIVKDGNFKPGTPNPEPITHILVHTGQHYDDRMSTAFFKSLGIPEADINLGIGSGTHAEQVGNTMIAIEKVLTTEKPDWVVVVGDVNATLACSVAAKKLHIKVCHIEAGLRSGDERMPEEINRLVTDRLSDLLLTPDTLSNKNLKAEGVPDSKIEFVGNIMIDTLETNRNTAATLDIQDIIKNNILNTEFRAQAPLPPKKGKSSDKSEERGNHIKGNYAILTMHRPSNVDKKEVLEPIIDFLINEVAQDMPIIWPIHPRTQKMLQQFGLWEKAVACQQLILLHPIGYHEMLRLNMNATIMLTDSGGLQEECCVLGTPCLTLRWNTERPVTLKEHGGASVLVGNNIERIREEYNIALKAGRVPQRPKLWDGETAERCVAAILKH
jgi:UDP-N-acetylglucosamine 2-epimerase (non-hydrolysing)